MAIGHDPRRAPGRLKGKLRVDRELFKPMSPGESNETSGGPAKAVE